MEDPTPPAQPARSAQSGQTSRTAGPDRPRRPVRPFWKALASLAVLVVFVAGMTALRMYREGYHFRNLKPSDWVLRWRGVYRYDPAHHIVRQGAEGVPMVALTFDDGPHPTTPVLLDILKAHGAHATFFLVGSNVVKRPDLVRRIAEEGNEVANHTRTHLRLPALREDQIRNELQDDTIVIARACGKRARLFRPPGGQYDDRVTAEAAREGMMTVLWSSNTGDWKPEPVSWITNRVLSTVEDGDIVLLHEDQPQTITAMPGILDGLRARGLQVVTVSELLQASHIPRPPLPTAPLKPAPRTPAPPLAGGTNIVE